MAILNFFKNKKKPLKKKPFLKKKPLEEKPLESKPSEKEPSAKKPLAEKPSEKPKETVRKISGVAYRVLREPHVSEKATALTEADKYVFKVLPGSNKSEIKKAIEDLYGVNVVSVRIINIPRKKRKLGGIEGWRKGYKKALVCLKKGQKIEVLPR